MTLPYYYGKAINLQLPCLNQLQPHYHDSIPKPQTSCLTSTWRRWPIDAVLDGMREEQADDNLTAM